MLRAADAILKPIRSGTVKAQAKGIIRDIHNTGHSLGRPTTGAHSSSKYFLDYYQAGILKSMMC